MAAVLLEFLDVGLLLVTVSLDVGYELLIDVLELFFCTGFGSMRLGVCLLGIGLGGLGLGCCFPALVAQGEQYAQPSYSDEFKEAD